MTRIVLGAFVLSTFCKVWIVVEFGWRCRTYYVSLCVGVAWLA